MYILTTLSKTTFQNFYFLNQTFSIQVGEVFTQLHSWFNSLLTFLFEPKLYLQQFICVEHQQFLITRPFAEHFQAYWRNSSTLCCELANQASPICGHKRSATQRQKGWASILESYLPSLGRADLARSSMLSTITHGHADPCWSLLIRPRQSYIKGFNELCWPC